MILDLGLPDIDGHEVLRQVRSSGSRLPVVILTARDELDDKVSGLDRGADDYVTKPFKFDELLARIRARLRPGGGTETTTVEVGGVRLDLRTRRATVDDRSITLTAREFTMLETLVRHRGQVLSREQLPPMCGATTTIRGRTWSTSTWATSARSSARTRSRLCAGWGM